MGGKGNFRSELAGCLCSQRIITNHKCSRDVTYHEPTITRKWSAGAAIDECGRIYRQQIKTRCGYNAHPGVSRGTVTEHVELSSCGEHPPLLCGKEGSNFTQTRGRTTPFIRGGDQGSVRSRLSKHIHEPSNPSILRCDTSTSFGRYIPQHTCRFHCCFDPLNEHYP